MEAEGKKCSLACANTAGSVDRLPCDKPETSWSKRLEEATVADTAAWQGEHDKIDFLTTRSVRCQVESSLGGVTISCRKAGVFALQPPYAYVLDATRR